MTDSTRDPTRVQFGNLDCFEMNQASGASNERPVREYAMETPASVVHYSDHGFVSPEYDDHGQGMLDNMCEAAEDPSLGLRTVPIQDDGPTRELTLTVPDSHHLVQLKGGQIAGVQAVDPTDPVPAGWEDGRVLKGIRISERARLPKDRYERLYEYPLRTVFGSVNQDDVREEMRRAAGELL